MFKVLKEVQFCYGHRLLHYKGPCAHAHGHNGRVLVTLVSETLDEQGMVFEFGDLKRILQDWIDQNLDHRMILHREDPLVKSLQDLEEPVYLMDRNPTAEAIAAEIFHYAKKQDLPVTEVTLWETPTACAVYSEE